MEVVTGRRTPPLPPALALLLGGAAAVIVLAGLKAAAGIAGPAFVALVLTLAVAPLRRLLAERNAPALVCVVVPLTAALAVLVLIGGSLAYSAVRLATELPAYEEQLAALGASVTGFLNRHGVGGSQAAEITGTFDPAKLVPLIEGFLSGLAGALAGAVLVVMLLYAMSLDALGLRRALADLAGERPAMVGALRGYATDTCRFLVVTTAFGLVVAVADTTALALLGVPLPLLWGLLSFITNYIPNVGFFIGLVPPALMALLDSGVGTMLWVIALYCVLNFVIQSLIQPKIVGDAARLSVTLTLLSLAVWSYVLGPVGAVLAVPLTLLVRALLIDAAAGRGWVDRLLAAS
ncbi:putative PurR-regulated permease PerM [Actinocorallia herbida]|uniref:Putative PurR-regulated permease PerM n=1 Tax=Actinocorallia herbida TaxID=58109 RepID=A0A3N1CWF3_9ACTN|nr:AI-2E family transporter [Actinocorallia herbida]ROO85617.1 putative PurR-regulated permease PerM [Actinocorallia herbida]